MSFKYSKEDLEEAVSKSTSFSGVLRELNAGTSGSTHQWIKNRIIALGIDYSHFTYSSGSNASGRRKSPEDILVMLPPDCHRRTPRRHLLYALLSNNIEYKCGMADCPNPEPVWRGAVLPLEIDHIDGNWRNNLLENLRFLCPNCHHQTETNRRGQAISAATLEEYEAVIAKLDAVSCPSCESPMRRRSKMCSACSYAHRQPRKTSHEKKNTYAPKKDICECGKEKSLRSKLCRSCNNSKLDRNTRTSYPPLEELVERVRASSFLAVSKELGVSDNAVRKYLRNRGVDVKSLARTRKQ